MDKILKYLNPKTFNTRAVFSLIILPYILNIWMFLDHGYSRFANLLIFGPVFCLIIIGLKNLTLKTANIAKKKINKNSNNDSSSDIFKNLGKKYDNWTSTKPISPHSIALKEEREKEDAIRERNRRDKEIALKEEKGKGLKSINDLEKNESPSVFKKNLQDTFGVFSDSETKQDKSNSNDFIKEEKSNFPSGITSLEKLKELKDKGLISDKNAKDIQKKLLDELIK